MATGWGIHKIFRNLYKFSKFHKDFCFAGENMNICNRKVSNLKKQKLGVKFTKFLTFFKFSHRFSFLRSNMNILVAKFRISGKNVGQGLVTIHKIFRFFFQNFTKIFT